MRTAVLTAVGVVLFVGASHAGDAKDYLTKEGKLKHALEFRDGQQGIAGITGRLWLIEPDGQWQVAQFRNEQTQKTLEKGKLSAKEIAALAGHLAALDVSELPKELGDFKGANPHVFGLRFGGQRVTVTVAAGQSLTETFLPDKEAAAWSRFVAAAALLQRWTAGSNSAR